LTRLRHILLLITCLVVKTAFSQNIEFVENKGQWDSRVKFMGDFGASAFFIHQNGYTVLQNHPDDWEKVAGHGHAHAHGAEKKTVRAHAYKVEFLGGNPNPEIIADKPVSTYNNYFIGNDPSKWASDCKIYQGITLKNIYPNIDIRYYSDAGFLKYDLIVKPGSNPSQILLKFDGPEKLEVKNKELVIKTSVGDLRELTPYSYQAKEKGREEVQVKYVIKNNILQFDVKQYDPKSTLIIDPTLRFCSFSKSTADNWGYTATYGPDGSMYGGGTVKGNGFPTTSGSFQQSFSGGMDDIGIIRLNADGDTRIYATYIGGSGDEQPHSLIVDGAGNVVVAGRTNSSNYPMTGSSIGPGGGYDIVITKLNASGTAIIGSKRIGGTSDDGVNINPDRNPSSLQRNYGDDARSEVILDNAGNILVASCTRSADFPFSNGFQNGLGGGQDGVVIKLNPNVSGVLFASFLGGTQNDAAYVLSISPTSGNIYVGGGTESANSNGAWPGATTGTVGPSYNGGIDGYISIISSDGSTLIRTAYIGTTAIDQVYGVQFDRLGFPYIMGQTYGNMPMSPGVWGQPNTKQFIAKLQPDLSAYVYQTTFGAGSSVPNISPVAFLVDRCENVYVSGWGGKIDEAFQSAGTFGLPVTPDAIKPTTDVPPGGVGQDLYFIVIAKNATGLLYGSFFGQDGGAADHVDGGTSRFDANGVIYQAVCGNCKALGAGSNIPTTPGSWSPTNPANSGSQCNLMMIKIEFDYAGVGSAIQSAIGGVPRDTAGCLPLTVSFRDTIANGVRYYWNFGDGSPTVVTTRPDTSHTYLQVGTYRVMLITEDSSTCNIRDTSYLNIRVGDLIARLNFSPVKLNPCDSFLYRFDNLSIAPPSRPFRNNSFMWDFGDGSPRVPAGTNSVTHRYASPGTYIVRLILADTAYCNYPDSLPDTLRVSAIVDASFQTPPTGCAPYNAAFNNTSQGGQQFFWDFGDGTTSTAANPTHLYTLPGTYTVRLIAIDSATCNIIDSAKFDITVYPIPIAAFTASPQPPPVNTPITFTNQSSPDAVRFKWLFGDGDSLITTSRAPIQHEYNATRTYTACLIAYNANDCEDDTCMQVSMVVEPALDVPNAFTPLTGDANSRIFVRGFGIAKMRFIIWSRWGEKVFESNDKRIGWDGKYKGKMMPMDVYAYTLEVEFSDGTKASKKGDITLIR
jgi:gliding motility-associated-like protein